MKRAALGLWTLAVLATSSSAAARPVLGSIAGELPAPPAFVWSARDAARRASELSRIAFADTNGELAWLPIAGGARMVWAFHKSLAPLPFVPVVALDATTGELLLRYNAVRYDRIASVHAQNPIDTPNPISIVLEALPFGATQLENADFGVSNCIDQHELVGTDPKVRGCTIEPRAFADAQGDFPYLWTSHTAPEDAHAEVSIFHHASRARAWFRALGMPDAALPHVDLVANLRLPRGWDEPESAELGDPNTLLLPFDNAFFAPENPFFDGFGPPGAALWFGQGSVADFSYDADIVVHELTHAVVHHTAALVGDWQLDAQGATPAPAAINEALADYFAAALAGDAQIGEYAATNFYQLGTGELRDLAVERRCPDHLTGDAHADSMLLSSALWAMRERSSNPNDLDRAVMAALLAMPAANLGFEAISELLAAAIEASPLGSTGADAFRAELAARGLSPSCRRVVAWSGTPIESYDAEQAHAFVAPGKLSLPLVPQAPYAPGLFQVQIELAPGTRTLAVELTAAARPSLWSAREAKPYRPALLVGWGAQPIEQQYEDGIAFAPNSEVVELAGDGAQRNATIEVPEGDTNAYVMVVNLGDDDGSYSSLAISEQAADPEDPSASGCGCELGSRSGRPRGSVSLLAFLAIVRLRRKPRARARVPRGARV